MDRRKPEKTHEATPGTDLPRRPQDETGHGIVRDRTDLEDAVIEPNPPRTTKGKMTSPKFGSAGSGGAELEPGPERP